MKPSRIVLAGMALLALAGLVLLGWYLGGGADARAARSALADPAVRAADPAAELAPDSGTTPGVSASERAAAAPGRASTAARRALDPDGLRVVLLEKGARRPLAGASAWVWTATGPDVGFTRDSEEWIGADAEAVIRRRGAEFVADEAGLIDLPPARATRFVVARADALYGCAEIHPLTRGLVEIALAPQHDLALRVVDARGNPVPRMRVGLGYCGDAFLFWEATTDEKGATLCRNLEALAGHVGLAPDQPFGVRVGTPADPPVEEWITLDRVGSDPIVLTLPPSGSMRVTIVDAAHARVPVSGTLRVRSAGTSRVAQTRGAEVGATAEIEHGIARLAHVGLDLDLQLEADFLGTAEAYVLVHGPRAAGEETSVEIEMPDDHTLLRGRIVDESGHPVARTAFDWRRLVDDGERIVASGRNTLTTDAEGRFTWSLRRSANVHSTAGAAARRGYLCEVGGEEARLQATIDFPNEIGAAGFELGDVRVVRRGPLLSGRVVGESGAGVAGVIVELRSRTGDGSYETADTFDPCVSGLDGRYAIFGPCLSIPLDVGVSSDGHEGSESTPFTCRGEPVTLDLHVTSRPWIRGSARVDLDASTDSLWVAFVPESGRENALLADVGRAGDQLSFRIGPLAPARGSVEFRTEDAPAAPLAVIFDVDVAAGARVDDPRLQDVDLRGKLPKSGGPTRTANTIEIEVVDARGRPLRSGFAWLWAADGSDFEEQLFANGRVRVAADDARSIEVWAPRHRTRFLEPPHRATRVTLASELIARASVEVPAVLQEGRFSFAGEAQLLVDEAHPSDRVPAALQRLTGFRLGADGSIDLRLPAAGTFVLTLVLSYPDPASPEEAIEYGLPLDPPTIDVREVDGEQRFRLHFEREALKQCLIDVEAAQRPR